MNKSSTLKTNYPIPPFIVGQKVLPLYPAVSKELHYREGNSRARMCWVHWLITDQVAAVEKVKVVVECVRPGHIRRGGGMGVSSWGVPATRSLTCAAGGTVQTEAGGQQCQFFQR